MTIDLREVRERFEAHTALRAVEIWSTHVVGLSADGAFHRADMTRNDDDVIEFGEAALIEPAVVTLSTDDSLLWEDPQRRLQNIVALAGTERVGRHKRTSKSGKVVDVAAYFRSPGKMSSSELVDAYTDLGNSRVTGLEGIRAVNQRNAIGNEMRRRGIDFGDLAYVQKEKTRAAAMNKINDVYDRLASVWDAPGKPALTKQVAAVYENRVKELKQQALEDLTDTQLRSAWSDRPPATSADHVMRRRTHYDEVKAEVQRRGFDPYGQDWGFVKNEPQTVEALLDKLQAAGKKDLADQARAQDWSEDDPLDQMSVPEIKRRLTELGLRAPDNDLSDQEDLIDGKTTDMQSDLEEEGWALRMSEWVAELRRAGGSGTHKPWTNKGEINTWRRKNAPGLSTDQVAEMLDAQGIRVLDWDRPLPGLSADVERLVALSSYLNGTGEKPVDSVEETDDVVALAGRVKVDAYKRTSKSGKVVSVDTYFRSPSSMNPKELVEALKGLRDAPSATPMENNRNRNQRRAIVGEMRRRGISDDVPTAPDANTKFGTLAQSDVQSAREGLKGGKHPTLAVNELTEKAKLSPKEKAALRKSLPNAKDDMDVIGPVKYAHEEGEKSGPYTPQDETPEGPDPDVKKVLDSKGGVQKPGAKSNLKGLSSAAIEKEINDLRSGDLKPGAEGEQQKKRLKVLLEEQASRGKSGGWDPDDESVPGAQTSPDPSTAEAQQRNAEAKAKADEPKIADEAAMGESGTPEEKLGKVKNAGRGRKEPDATGTLDDPIDVDGDLNLAAQRLAEGKHVRLNKVDEVGTLLDKLNEIVDAAKQQGDSAPTFDLCKVSVPDTNLFCAESKGIPRAKMPQFSGSELVPGSTADQMERNSKGEVNIEAQFRDKLAEMGVKITPKTVNADYLKASQNELDGPKVAGMSRAMEEGKVPDAPIFVTRDGYIIDGHHRWASKVAIDAKDGKMGDVKMMVEELDFEIGEALDFANQFALMMGIKPKGLGAAAEGVKLSREGLTGAIANLIALASR